MTLHGNFDRRRISRRQFVGLTGSSAAALALLGPGSAFANRRPEKGFGELVPDEAGLLDLPRDFRYRVISEEGKTMTDGTPTPGDFDGMATFDGPGKTTVLVRNHELRPGDPNPVFGKNPYDPTQIGGTSALIVNRHRKLEADYVTSSGTTNNCAGGGTPWGTWLTCEEDRTTNHGYVYEVMWDDAQNALSKTPIREMGFFSHEAIDIDPATGIVYLTEDDFRGTIHPTDPNLDTRSSFLYRYLPNDRRQRPGALQQGGTLQALAIDQGPRDADFWNPGQRFGVPLDHRQPRDRGGGRAREGCDAVQSARGVPLRGRRVLVRRHGRRREAPRPDVPPTATSTSSRATA
jgi:secreted PhoX family phosphatase